MKNFLSILSGLAVCGSAHATVTFHSNFDEASLGAITGLNIDTPNTSGADSGTVTLDTISQRLDLTSNGANLWTAREGAPIAWVASPSVSLGETWYVQTQITHTNSPGGGGTNSGWDQAGITFFSGTPGNNPGSENGGTHQSLFAGISDWNQWHHRVQGFADNNPNVSVAADLGDDTFEYRVEVTEGGASDLFNFFYREDSADPWTSFGPTDLSQDFDSSAVGLFIKSNNANTTASTEFEYFTVGVVPEPSTGILACLAGFAFVLRRRRR